MTKFEDASDPGFTAVAGELRRWIKEVVAPTNTGTLTVAAPQQEQVGQQLSRSCM